MSLLARVRERLNEYVPYYDAPTGDLKRYDQNVNLLGPHPAIATTNPVAKANLYPDRDNRRVLEALAARLDFEWRHFWVGNGSDDVLDLCLRLFLEPGQRLVVPSPSYSMYPHLARLSRVAYVPVETDEDFQTSAARILAQKPDMVLVCNPNNPTGTLMDPRVVGEILESFDGPVLVDEAYADFSETSVAPLVDTHPNLLVARTLSKAYGLAGLRIGYGIAHPDVAELVRRAKPPFTLNRYCEGVAVNALADPAPVDSVVATVRTQRQRLAKGLQALGFRVWPSHANFLLTLPPIPNDELRQALKQRGILVRLYEHEPRLAEHVRFTIGTQDDTDGLLAAVGDVLDGARPTEVNRE